MDIKVEKVNEELMFTAVSERAVSLIGEKGVTPDDLVEFLLNLPPSWLVVDLINYKRACN